YYWSLEPMKVSHDTENRFLPYRYPAYRMIPGFSQNPKNLSCSQKKLLPRRPSPQKTIRTYSSERQDETERNRRNESYLLVSSGFYSRNSLDQKTTSMHFGGFHFHSIDFRYR